MSLYEKQIIHALQQFDDEQLLDIKYHGYNSPEFQRLEEDFDASHYRTFTLGRVAGELIQRGLMTTGFDFDIWWEQYTGY